jgi:hypothetical protein
VTVPTRLVAVLGFEALHKILQRSWTYALVADFPAQIGGTFYICVWVRIPSLSMNYDVNDLHVVAPPIFGSHKGEYMVNVTS